MWWSPDRPGRSVLIAVADGHGGRRYVRSDRGARLACQVAQEVAIHFDERESGLPTAREVDGWIGGDLARLVTGRWRTLVTEDLDVNPLAVPDPATDAESLPDDADADTGDRPGVEVYGSTLMFALMTADFSVFFHLGDGDLQVVTEDGARVEPVEDPDPLLGTDVRSLAAPDAWRFARVEVVPSDSLRPGLVLAASDGLATSFRDPDGLVRFVDGVIDLVRGGTDADDLTGRLQPALERYTSQGSGDDITVVVAWRPDVMGLTNDILAGQPTVPNTDGV